MHEFWETTDDIEALRDALRQQGQMVKVLSDRHTALALFVKTIDDARIVLDADELASMDEKTGEDC